MPVRRRTDNGNWLIDFTDERGRCRKTIDRQHTKRQVEGMERRFRQERAEGTAKRRGRAYRWQDLANRYWDEHAQHLPSAPTIRGQLTRLSDGLGDATLVTEITGSEVASMVARWRSAKITDSTINHYLTTMTAVWNRAIDVWGMSLHALPWKKLRLPEPESEPRWVNIEDLRRLLACCDTHIGHAVEIAVLTGLRLGPILRLTWEQIDLVDGVILAKGKGKGGHKPNPVPITPDVRALLERLGPRDVGPVITFRGRALTTIWRGWQNARRRAGLPHIRFHDLRHTFGQALLDETGNLSLVKDAMHHSDQRTTERYAKRSRQQITDALTRLQAGRKLRE